MERLEAEDLLEELESFSPGQFDLMNPLIDLTSGRKNFIMCKYLDLHEEEPWPLLAEYFGVALAFAALGALIHGVNGSRGKEDMKDSGTMPQRMALQTMLKGAMERLQDLAQNAQNLQERLTESTESKENDRNDWDQEKVRFVRRIADAEEEVKELKKLRLEDAKANEKVVRIYANREHGWKIEKKKLRHEIDMLRKDLINHEASGLCSPRDSLGTGQCNECELKARRLIDLEKKLKEREHMIKTAMENGRIKEAECSELTSNLAAEKAITSELNEKLNNELANSAEREKVLDEVRDREQATECRLAKAVEELDSTKDHLEALSAATENHSEMTQKLLVELATLRQESEDKDIMISTMLERATVEREEKEDLSRELATVESGKQTAEAESGRWRRLAEERTRQNLSIEVPDASRSGHRYHRSLGSRSEFEKIADLQKSHVEEVNNLRATYSRQVEALEKQMAMYRAKAQAAASTPIPALLSADLLEPLSDPAFKAWFEVVKGRFATQLEEKHWNQVETFERHLRAKEERLSAFRSKLITLESELAQSRKKVESLGCDSSPVVNVGPTDSNIEQIITMPEKILKDVECMGCERMAAIHQRSLEKLRMELKDAKDKLKEKEAEHLATIENISENTESELQHKDVQIAVLEAKLCQVQLQLEEAKLANEMVSPDKCEEKMFLECLDETQEPQPEEVLCSTRYDGADVGNEALENREEIAEKKEEGICCEGLIQLDNSVFDSAKLLTQLKDMCLKEEKPPAMIRFHRKLELETSDSLIFSTDDCWLTAEQKTGEMSLQFLPVDDIPVPAKAPSPACVDKNVAFARKSPRPQCGRDIKTLVVHKKTKKGVNKQPLSPDARAYQENARQTFNDILFTQAPSKGTRPARLDMSNMLEEQKSQRTLFSEIDGLQSPITNPTFITQESVEKLVFDDERKKSSTREDIQVLGLALEVRRIEQQLSQMNTSIGDAQTLLSRSVRSVESPVKQTQRCIGLAGKVSQFARQIGLTKSLRKASPKSRTEVKKESSAPIVPRSDLCLRKNPLFLQESSAADLASLQQRAEKVGENLSAIQAKIAKESSPDFYEPRYKPSMFPKGKLVDTVRTHLSQVQGALHSKLAQTTTSTPRPLPLSASKQSSPPPKTILTPRKPSTPAKPLSIASKPVSPPSKPASPSSKPVSPPSKPVSPLSKPVSPLSKPVSTDRKPLSPTNPAVTPSSRRITSFKPTSTLSPRRVTSTKLLTPLPRSFTPAQQVTQALSPSEGRGGSTPNRTQVLVHPKTTMLDFMKDDYRTRTAFGRNESRTKSIHDQQPRQWAKKTSKHYELDLEHLR